MKGDEKVLERLNKRLAHELAVVNQYMVHAEMCDNWGYEKLSKAVEKRAIEEMKHAEKLISRILFLDGVPMVSNLDPIHIGATVPNQYANDWSAEDAVIKAYNEDIQFFMKVGDNGSRELVDSILKEEENHIDWIEAQLAQIDQMGIQNYLVERTD
jgi:bacterioferritin